MYKIVGYYICEKLDIPNFLGILFVRFFYH